jgi:glyoxylate reductase
MWLTSLASNGALRQAFPQQIQSKGYLMSHAPKVIVTRKLPPKIEERLSELFDVELNASDTPFTPAQLRDAMQRADVLVPTITDKIDSALLGGAGPQLKLIANFGAGVDNIDVETARTRGIVVTNTPDVLTDDTADMTMALIMAVARRIPQGLDRVRSGTWGGWSPMQMLGGRITGKRIGIIGMGRIGRAVALRARAFGMEISYHNRRRLDPRIEEQYGARYDESLDQMIARMDILTLHCPATPSSFHIMNARRIELMKPNAVLINTSRGEVVDENALARALRQNKIAGVGLDVFEHGTQINPYLLEQPNAVLLPHMGSATQEGRLEMGEKILINIKTFADGHRPPDQVFASDL